MAARSTKAANVLNPSSYHTVRLEEGQDVVITMDQPSDFNIVNPGEWSTTTNSHFLRFERSEKFKQFVCHSSKKGSRIGKQVERIRFCYKVQNVLPRWWQVSSLFLGNIFVRNKNTIWGTVCVYLNCDTKKRKSIITIIDPTPDQCVKIEPSELLEVVLSEPPFKRLTWKAYCMPQNSRFPTVNLGNIRSDYLAVGTNYNTTKIDDLFYGERRILPQGESSSPTFGEHHLWFAFDELDDETLNKVENGVHDATAIHFVGKDIDGNTYPKVDSLKTNVLLNYRARTPDREAERVSIKRTIVKDPTTRMFDENKLLLINPTAAEQITITDTLTSIIVEIADPSCYFPKCTDAQWKIKIGEVRAGLRVKDTFVKVHSIPPKLVNGVRFDRFVITPRTVPDVFKVHLLGEVILYLDVEDLPYQKCKRSLYIVLDRKITRRQSKQNISSPKITLPKSGSKNSFSYDDYSRITIKEIYSGNDVKGGSVDVETLERFIERTRYKKKNKRQRYNLYDDPNVDLPIISSVSDDLKSIPFDTLDNGYITQPSSSLPFPEAVRLMYQNAIESKKKESDTKTKGSSSKETEGEEKMTSLNPICIVDPKNGDHVTIKRGRPILICCTLPTGALSEGKILNQWCANTISFKPDVCNLWLASSKLVEYETVPYQEFTIKPLIRDDFKQRTIHAGNIIFDDARGNKKYVSVTVETSGPEQTAQYYRDYYLSYMRSKPVNVGMVSREYNNIENRITLINPVDQELRDIEVGLDTEVEILFEERNRAGTEGWNLDIRKLTGDIEVMDNTIYPSTSRLKYHRFLLRVKCTNGKHWSEIRPTFDKENLGIRLRLHKPDMLPKKHKNKAKTDSSTLKLLGDSKNGNKICITDWKHRERVPIFPCDHVYIEVPMVENFLPSELRAKHQKPQWSIRMTSYSLEEDVVEELANDTVDADLPWYSDEDCMFQYGVAPWSHQYFVMKPLQQVQPFVYDIIDSMHVVHKCEDPRPIAEVSFKYESEDFRIERKLYLDVADPTHFSNETPEKIFQEPQDNASLTVDSGRPFSVSIRNKYLHAHESDVMEMQRWHLVGWPGWLETLRTKRDKNFTHFKFKSSVPDNREEIRGVLTFSCGNLTKKLGLVCRASR